MSTLSILTICKNDSAGLQRTIDSVSSQTMRPHEFIVQDGSSADNTLDILTSCPVVTSWRSISDKGIADAFNAVAKQASGEWLLFLNSGDLFADNSVIADSLAFLNQVPNDVGVVYGNVELLDNQQYIGLIHCDATELTSKNSLCHQACFVRRKIQLEFAYDLRLKIGMDYDLWLRLQKKTNFKHFNRTIAQYSLGGISSSRKWAEHSVIAHHMVRWLNLPNEVQLNIWHVTILLFDVLKLVAKKRIESILGDRAYGLLKKFTAK